MLKFNNKNPTLYSCDRAEMFVSLTHSYTETMSTHRNILSDVVNNIYRPS